MFVVDCCLEGGADRVGVGAAGGVFAVDGFDGDTTERLKLSFEKVVQDAEVVLHLRIVARHIEFQRLGVSLGYHDNLATSIDEVGTRNAFGQFAFDGVKLDAAQ